MLRTEMRSGIRRYSEQGGGKVEPFGFGPYYTGKSSALLSGTGQGPSPCFNADGTRLYIVNSVSDVVYQYPISTPWDMTTLGNPQALAIGAQESNAVGLTWSVDGLFYYICGNGAGRVWRYAVTTPWDIMTTQTSPQSYLVGTSTTPRGIQFSPDGARLFVVQQNNRAIAQFDLPTPWSLTGVTYSKAFSYSGQTNGALAAFCFSPDGQYMFLGDGQVIYRYKLATAWDVGAPGFIPGVLRPYPNEAMTPNGVIFSPDGESLFITSNDTVRIYEYKWRDAA